MNNSDLFLVLLEKLRAYCARIAPGEVPTNITIDFASGRSPLSHPIPPPGLLGPPRLLARHSEDYRKVHWFGLDYTFTPTQAACVRVLWEAWEDGDPELGQETILRQAGSESSRLAQLFQDSPAWGEMIVKGTTKGSFRLEKPED